MILGDIIGIDPGTEESGYVRFRPNYKLLAGRGYVSGYEGRPPGQLLDCGIERNPKVRAKLMGTLPEFEADCIVAIEIIQSYGRQAGASTIQTCEWIGVFCDRAKGSVHRMWRGEWCKWIMLPHNAKDPEIRRMILDMWGGEKLAKGTKKNKGELYYMKSHMWSALGVALGVASKLAYEHRKELDAA